MTKPLSHQGRARAAVVRVIGEAASPEERDIVAQETFPRELVEAAMSAEDCPNKTRGLCSGCRKRLRNALDLYKEEPDHE